MNFAPCLHIVLVIGNYTEVFRSDFSYGWGGGDYVGGSPHGGCFQGEGTFLYRASRISHHYLKTDQKL